MTNNSKREAWEELVKQAHLVGVYKDKIGMLTPARNASARIIDERIVMLRNEINLAQKATKLSAENDILDLLCNE